MIDAYAWTTPNGFKLLVALEELGIPHELHWVDLGKGEQKTPAYLAINPNGKIPAIVDHDGPGGERVAVFESGAVLTYLAEKTGKLTADRIPALEWMFFSAGSAPMFGQLGYHMLFAPEKDPKAIARFTTEVERLLGVHDKQLASSRFLVGDAFTVVDIMSFTWPRAARDKLGIDATKFPNVNRWVDEIEARPAVQRALAMKPPG